MRGTVALPAKFITEKKLDIHGQEPTESRLVMVLLNLTVEKLAKLKCSCIAAVVSILRQMLLCMF